MNIENKTFLITGANRGIGRALVYEALRRGAKRVYAGTRSARENDDQRVTPLTPDVTNVAQIQRAAAEVGALDVLINNAGVAIYDDLSNYDVIEQHLDVNFLGMLKMTQAFLPLLKRSRGGHRQQSFLGCAGRFADDTRLLHFKGSRVQHDASATSEFGPRRSNCPCGLPGSDRH